MAPKEMAAANRATRLRRKVMVRMALSFAVMSWLATCLPVGGRVRRGITGGSDAPAGLYQPVVQYVRIDRFRPPRQRDGQLFQRLIEAFAQLVGDLRGPVSFRIGNLLVRGKYTAEHFLGLQCSQDRLERVVHCQKMRRPATAG